MGLCTLELPFSEEDEPQDVAGVPALYVHPDAFGTDAGGALMDAATDAIRQRGYSEAILWMLDGNQRAARFYQRRGWVRDGGARLSDWPGIAYVEDGERPPEVRFRRSL